MFNEEWKVKSCRKINKCLCHRRRVVDVQVEGTVKRYESDIRAKFKFSNEINN